MVGVDGKCGGHVAEPEYPGDPCYGEYSIAGLRCWGQVFSEINIPNLIGWTIKI